VSRRVVIIGLDGVPFDLLKELSEKGIMPNVKEIIHKGIFKRMQSSIPEVSCVAWASIITGRNPAEHGIFGFTDLYPNSYKLTFPNFNSLRSVPFWNAVEGRSVIINVPSTYPVREMNGVHISGFVSMDLERSVYPKPLMPKLNELDYRLDVDSEKAHKSMQLFLSDLDKTLQARIKTYQYLWDNFKWQTFMLVFTGTDRLMHFLWDAYEDENHEYHEDFLDHFRKIDEAIGQIYAKIDDEDLLVILSDHGFERLDKDVYINYLLRGESYLEFKGATPELSNINSSTKAFALDPARIYINLKGKYSSGSVDEGDREKILRDLEALFTSLEIDNKKLIKRIYRKEDIYSGPLIGQAPDLILVGNRGFNLKANIKKDVLTDKDIFTGKHTQDSAFLLVNGPYDADTVPDNPKVFDIQRIIQSLSHVFKT